MRLLIIGASGRAGRQVTEQALMRGHSVTAVMRSVSSEEGTASTRSLQIPAQQRNSRQQWRCRTWNLQFRDLAACLLDLSEGKLHTREIVGVASL